MPSFKTSLGLLSAACSLVGSCLPLSAMAQTTPVISEVSPVSAVANTPVTLSVNITSSVAITSCNLYIDLEDVGAMGVSGNVASKSYTFASGGSKIAFVFCRNAEGKANSGPNTAIWVDGQTSQSEAFSGGGQMGGDTSFSDSAATVPPTPVPTSTIAAPAAASTSTGRLIKLACADGAAVEDPCHAVYFQGVDGKRHAFPNSKIFFTWYADFSSVVEVDPGTLGSILLGRNVAYRPGSRMVKFVSIPSVYAVGKGGVLRWITSEAMATALYGANWNTKIDDLDEAFFTDYTFGADIKTTTDFNPTVEMQVTTGIDQTL